MSAPAGSSSNRIVVLRHGNGRYEQTPEGLVLTVDHLHSWLRSGSFLRHLWRYRDARIRTHRLETIGRPLKLAIFLRLLSHGSCVVEDESGRERPLSPALIARWAWQSLREPFGKAALLDRYRRDVEAIAQAAASPLPALRLEHQPLYLRTDLSFGLKAGGSVGHIAGVINHLSEFGGAPIMMTTDVIPMVSPVIEVHTVPPAEAFWEYPELPGMLMNDQFLRRVPTALKGRPISFVYQRYSLNNFSGARVAQDHRVPFVLEYNGSEIWMSRHWGTPLQYEALSTSIEYANFAAASLIVVVSQAMADELTGRGVTAAKILVNPNGVEADMYSPEVNGGPVRASLGLEGKLVVGFIGTFGPWHGAEVLAAAFAAMIKASPALRDSVRLLMIGDGVKMAEVRAILARERIEDLVVLTGIVPQHEGPDYLAACDILASPHVPNPDGTPFFGSPTKLFEYMAMGKAIVASDLDQVGEILEHGRAAHMTVPGSIESLADGLRTLIDQPQRRAELGAEARRLAVSRHTWQEHVRRIVDALKERAGAE